MHELIQFALSQLLGSDVRTRLRLKRTLMAATVYASALGLQWADVLLGRAQAREAAVLSTFIAVGVVSFYVAIRSGSSLRLQDPALTMTQMVFGFLAMALAYLVNPKTRECSMLLGTLMPMFGAFTLSRSQCRQLGWVGVLAFGAAMAFGTWHDPTWFVPQIEALHFLFATLVMCTLSRLAGQLSDLRRAQQLQKGELRDAMQRLALQASHDELTGLPNRRHLREWIGELIARSSRSAAPLCLALIDIDHFKRVNDILGHDVGDHTLRIFARESRSVLRAGDLLGRWGGEEFLLVMPDTEPADALMALARLRAHLALPATWGECPLGRVTYSAGLAVHAPGQTVEQTVDRADQALYAAKHAGRDRTLLVDALPPGPKPSHRRPPESGAASLSAAISTASSASPASVSSADP